jgi:uncharacterized protein YggE
MAEERILRVQGHGEVQVAPDQARVMLGVHTIDTGVQAAVERNSEAAQSVLDALKEAGLPESAVLMSQFNIYFNDHEKTYTANNQITVRVTDVSSVGRVLGLAIHAGANISGGISFELADSSEAEREALRRAAVDARSRAETLAAALGLALGDVIAIESPPPSPIVRPVFARAPMAVAGPSEVPVAGGQLTISAGVEAVYRIGGGE